ncbi:MAG: sugar ABC transporter permease [Armatimonadetes bacterium]|nr:sugar ABC transporter permease [Armatimonadota bacterium]
MQKGRTTFIALMLLPAVLLYGLFVLYPMAQSFHLSLYEWSGLSARKTFIGLQNYRQLFTEQPPEFTRYLMHNLLFLVVGAAVMLPAGLFVASVLSSRIRGAGFFLAVYLFPNVITVVAVASLWFFIYDRDAGLLNAALGLIGLGALKQTWLAGSTSLFAIIAVNIWAALGFYILLFAAGIRNIPQAFNEAAEIDGATGILRFRYITFPLVWEVFKLGVLYLIIHALNVFGLVYVMNQNQSNSSTDVLLTYLYQKGFADSQFGYAAAVAAVGFVITLLAVLFSLRLLRRETVQY